ncbi:hypothetical protein RFM10_11525, partial [Streptococcus suis]
INKAFADGVGVTVHSTTHPFIMAVKQVYQFLKPHKPQKVVVPKFVAEWIEECKGRGCPLRAAMKHINLPDKVNARSCFIICHSAYGDEQFDGEYCDQSCGYSEDDYHGVYYYPIGENLYFAYNYEC